MRDGVQGRGNLRRLLHGRVHAQRLLSSSMRRQVTRGPFSPAW